MPNNRGKGLGSDRHSPKGSDVLFSSIPILANPRQTDQTGNTTETQRISQTRVPNEAATTVGSEMVSIGNFRNIETGLRS